MEIEEEEEEKAQDVKTWTPRNCGLKINNLVVTCRLADGSNPQQLRSLKLNLRAISSRWHGVHGCNHKTMMFPAIELKFINPKGGVNLPALGKVVCAGTRNKEEAIFLIRRVCSYLTGTLGVPVVVMGESFKVQNIASSATLPGTVSLHSLHLTNEAICTYNPSNFPAATLRPTEISPIIVLVFDSGKIVISGSKDEAQIKTAFEVAVRLISPHVKPPPATPSSCETKKVNYLGGV